MKKRITEIADKLAEVRDCQQIPEETYAGLSALVDELSNLGNGPGVWVKFNPYPATRPQENTNYLVASNSGFTDSCWYDQDGDEWFANEHSNLPETDIIGWADFPFVSEASPTKHYVLVVWDDIQPQLIGPFETPGERDGKAREIRAQYGKENGIFPVDSAGAIDINSYSGAFFDE